MISDRGRAHKEIIDTEQGRQIVERLFETPSKGRIALPVRECLPLARDQREEVIGWRETSNVTEISRLIGLSAVRWQDEREDGEKKRRWWSLCGEKIMRGRREREGDYGTFTNTFLHGEEASEDIERP